MPRGIPSFVNKRQHNQHDRQTCAPVTVRSRLGLCGVLFYETKPLIIFFGIFGFFHVSVHSPHNNVCQHMLTFSLHLLAHSNTLYVHFNYRLYQVNCFPMDM